MNRLEMQRLSSAMFTVLAVVILAGVIAMEDEPTALAPLLVLLGVGWHVVTRIRIRRARESAN